MLIDFSKAFDTVDHAILLEKVSKLPLPAYCINWLISFLTGRTHTTRNQLIESAPLSINRSIIQGSGIGPTLYIIMESDLKSQSQFNIIFKYADDTDVLVPQHTDINMKEEFEAIQLWAMHNKLIINVAKTKKLYFVDQTLDIILTILYQFLASSKLLKLSFLVLFSTVICASVPT